MRLPNPIRTINELLAGADAAARRLGDASPGPEHLLLAALAAAARAEADTSRRG